MKTGPRAGSVSFSSGPSFFPSASRFAGCPSSAMRSPRPSTMTAKVTGLIPAGNDRTARQPSPMGRLLRGQRGSGCGRGRFRLGLSAALLCSLRSDRLLRRAMWTSKDRTYRAALPKVPPIALVPEVSLFSGSWIWDRLDSMDHAPLFSVFSVAGGFLLLAIGFRFLCRLSGWPLANAFLAVAGLGGPPFPRCGALRRSRPGNDRRLGQAHGPSFFPDPVLLACVEGAIGLALGAAELAAYPRKREAVK